MTTSSSDQGVQAGDLPPQTNLLGKRYRCEVCGLELLCVKPGGGRFSCHGKPLEPVTMTALPASD